MKMKSKPSLTLNGMNESGCSCCCLLLPWIQIIIKEKKILKTGISSYVSHFVNTHFGLPLSVLPVQNQLYIWSIWYIDKFEYVRRGDYSVYVLLVYHKSVWFCDACGRIWSVLAASHQVGSFPQQPRSGIRPQRWSIFRAMRCRWFIFQQWCDTDYLLKSLTSPSSQLFSLIIGNDYFSIILLILGLIILGLFKITNNHPKPPVSTP